MGWLLQYRQPCPPAASLPAAPGVSAGSRGLEMKGWKCAITSLKNSFISRHLPRKTNLRPSSGKSVVSKWEGGAGGEGWGTSDVHTCLVLFHGARQCCSPMATGQDLFTPSALLRQDQGFFQVTCSSLKAHPLSCALSPSCIHVHRSKPQGGVTVEERDMVHSKEELKPR